MGLGLKKMIGNSNDKNSLGWLEFTATNCPNTKSAKKRLKQTEKRRMINKSAKSRMKTFIKKSEKDILINKKNYDIKLISDTIRIIAKTASKGIIHKKTASRKISKLTKKSNLVNL